MENRGYAMWLAGACASALASGASAQSVIAPPQVPPQVADQPADNSQEIIITALKRPQQLIDVPQSVSVIGGGTLEEQHAKSFEDYLKLVPGLDLEQERPGEGRLILRGVNTDGVASTVGVYVDETPFGSSTGLVNGAVLAGDFDTFDLNRIEVLRGPQGTLYGANSLSGVLRFVTNAPSTAGVEVRGQAGLESVDHGGVGFNADAMVNVPLSQTIALRASGFYRKDAGFIDSIGTGGSEVAKNINSDRSYGGRGSLLFKPSDAVSIRLTAIAQNIDANAPSDVEADPVTLQPLHGLSESEFVPQFSNLRYRTYNGTGNFDLGFAKLTTSTSYETQKQRERIDFTNALSPLLVAAFGFPANDFFEAQDTNLKKFTQEVRLSSQTRVVDWLVGAYYTDEKGLIDQNFVAVQPGTLNPIDPLPIIGTTLGSATVSSKYKELAGFADATVHFTQQFDLELGGRYSHNKQSAEQTTAGALAGGTQVYPVATSAEHVFTYSVAPKFKFDRNTMVYARVAKGFRPGGPNVLPPISNIPSQVPRFYHSDSVVSYEAGIKAESSDHRLSIDAAAFHINWKNIQLFTTVSGFGVNTNGSSAKSDGFEFTAAARPMSGLLLSANAAYTNARLTGATPATVGGRDGDQLPFTPKLSFALNAGYEWHVGPGAKAHVGASWRHLSGQTAGYDSDFVAAYGRQRHIPAYSVIDLDAGIDVGHFSIDAYVKNLADKHAITSVSALTVFGPSPDTGFPLYPGGAIGTGIIRPRTLGVSVGFHY